MRDRRVPLKTLMRPGLMVILVDELAQQLVQVSLVQHDIADDLGAEADGSASALEHVSYGIHVAMMPE